MCKAAVEPEMPNLVDGKLLPNAGWLDEFPTEIIEVVL